jgi:hypothetical protein
MTSRVSIFCAVENDKALDKAVGLARQSDAVEIAAGSEEGHLAVVHNPHCEKFD